MPVTQHHTRDAQADLPFLGYSLCLCACAAVGLNVFYLTLGLKHGLLEFVALLSTFTLTARLLTGSYTKPLGKHTTHL